jgi:hypothetical protein
MVRTPSPRLMNNKISQIDEISGRIDELTTTINQLETVGFRLDADTGNVEISAPCCSTIPWRA